MAKDEASNAGSRPLFSAPSEARTKTSDVLLSLADRALEPDLSLRTLTERLGDRTFGMLLILVAILSAVPVVSMLAGALVAVLGLQMAAGMKRAWLPGIILDRQLPGKTVRAALLAFEPKVRAAERYVRPRWRFTEAPIVDRLNGLVIALLGGVIALPIPLTNVGPAFVVVFMGVGLMERDGLVQLSSVILAVVASGAIYYFVLAGIVR